MNKRLLISILAALFPVIAAADDQKKEVQYGKYVCLTDRAVGLQGEKPQERYAGSIKMGDDKKKFIVTLKKIESISANDYKNWVQDDIMQHIPERCFSQENIDKLAKNWHANESNSLLPDADEFFRWCLARSTAEVKTGGRQDDLYNVYYSTGKNVFLNFIGDRFWMSRGWTFRWNFGNFSGDHYMLEGRCDLVE